MNKNRGGRHPKRQIGESRAGRTAFAAGVFLAAMCLAPDARAQPEIFAQLSLDKLADFSLEQLGNIKVSSVSRRQERLLQAPASVFVITPEDIRRSGARSLPEVLRLAPNLQVARTSAGQWAISARGFNNAIGNKLLVLVDGRTIYSPLFSGVWWDQQDVVLEDVEQIEVISGPGGALWGANAVNGVINVTTRPASQTQGSLVSVSGGDGNQNLSARYGGKLGDTGAWRLYAMGVDRKNTSSARGARIADDARKQQIGWRADWDAGIDRFNFQGDAYEGGTAPGTPESPQISGANLLASWKRALPDGSGWRLQGYYDQSRRDEPFSFRDDMEIFDIEWQRNEPVRGSHRVLWGANVREARDSTQPSFLVRFIPGDRSLRWASVFAQDEIRVADQLELTLGAKLERNVYTGWEFLPSARLSWTPSDEQLGWAALSRAVRAPARLDREFFFPGNAPFFIRGGPDFRSEVANVLELGWRAQPSRAMSYSVTAFHHRYDHLRSGQPPPAVVQNMMEGSTSGLEAWAQWQAAEQWRLSAGLLELRQHLRVMPGSTDPIGPSALGNDPRHQWSLRSSHNLGHGHELDVSIRRVGALPLPAVPAYTALDARWGWRVSPDVDVALNLQNLLDRGHVEFGAVAGASEVRRAAWLKVTWRR
ncbi:MAG: TonB-dependent receptor [Pseudomonadota bacterium]